MVIIPFIIYMLLAGLTAYKIFIAKNTIGISLVFLADVMMFTVCLIIFITRA